nr:AI-2E family transporter [Porphyromonas macacae]
MQDAINERNDFRTPKFYWACLVILIIFLGIVFLYEGWAYISGLMGAVTLFAMERRQMRALTVKYKWKRSWAASVLVLEALLFFLIPLTGIIMMMIDVFTGLTIDFDAIIMEINQISELIEEKIGFDLLTIENLGFLPKMGSAIVQFLLANTYSIVMNGVIILFILFYMLYNYESFQQAIKELLPFNKENRQILLEESDQIIRANAIGIPLLAIIQGLSPMQVILYST